MRTARNTDDMLHQRGALHKPKINKALQITCGLGEWPEAKIEKPRFCHKIDPSR
jgi:hypothetical protein